jgi:hypothetical protein
MMVSSGMMPVAETVSDIEVVNGSPRRYVISIAWFSGERDYTGVPAGLIRFPSLRISS